MRILIDADGCPVVDLAIEAGRKNGLEVILFCDTSHEFSRPGARTVTVSKGADSVDFALVNEVRPGDIVVTQDYGLAAMALAKGAVPVSQDGLVYTSGNIDRLLEVRWQTKRIRQSGGRVKGPRKRTREQDEAFIAALARMMGGGSGTR